MVFVTGVFLEKIFYIRCDETLPVKPTFKAIDDYKKTLPELEQCRMNIHVWGQFEYDMLNQSGTKMSVVPNVDLLIKQCKVLLGF